MTGSLHPSLCVPSDVGGPARFGSASSFASGASSAPRFWRCGPPSAAFRSTATTGLFDRRRANPDGQSLRVIVVVIGIHRLSRAHALWLPGLAGDLVQSLASFCVAQWRMRSPSAWRLPLVSASSGGDLLATALDLTTISKVQARLDSPLLSRIRRLRPGNGHHHLWRGWFSRKGFALPTCRPPPNGGIRGGLPIPGQGFGSLRSCFLLCCAVRLGVGLPVRSSQPWFLPVAWGTSRPAVLACPGSGL